MHMHTVLLLLDMIYEIMSRTIGMLKYPDCFSGSAHLTDVNTSAPNQGAAGVV